LLKILLQQPGWAPGLPMDAVLPDREGAALLALCAAVDHGELPAGGLGTVIEFFRGTDHEPLFDEVVGEIAAENFDESAMEAVFNDALARMRHAGLSQEIAALNAKERAEGLSADERRRLAQLLSQKHAASGPTSADDL
jgi:DNA primase